MPGEGEELLNRWTQLKRPLDRICDRIPGCHYWAYQLLGVDLQLDADVIKIFAKVGVMEDALGKLDELKYTVST